MPGGYWQIQPQLCVTHALVRFVARGGPQVSCWHDEYLAFRQAEGQDPRVAQVESGLNFFQVD